MTNPRTLPLMSSGVSLSLLASVLFGVMYYFSTLLAPLQGEDIFAWRMIFTVPFLVAFVGLGGDFKAVRELVGRVRETPALALAVVLSSALIGVQLWLFLWAPPAGKALEVSLGYFMLPLTMALTGRVLFGDRLTGWQKLAAASASVGVAHEIVRVGGFPPEALVVALGYPLYFALRRRFRLDNIGGLWFDLVLLLPAAAWLAHRGRLDLALLSHQPGLLWMIPLLGLISAVALIAYILSSRRLPFGLFGLLGYVEPVLLVLVALLLGETLPPGALPTYGPIWLAVGFLAVEGAIHLRRRRAGSPGAP